LDGTITLGSASIANAVTIGSITARIRTTIVFEARPYSVFVVFDLLIAKVVMIGSISCSYDRC
jgi:hypothetical protein